jgi:hypothetical protein
LDSSTLLLLLRLGNCGRHKALENRGSNALLRFRQSAPQAQFALRVATATILIAMRPQRIGRVLGVGVRVAGRMAGERLAGPASNSVPSSSVQAAAQPVAAVAQASRRNGSVMRGLGGFARPFTRVGGIVFLEVVGVFFLLFVLVFSQMAWRLRDGMMQGPHHQKFLVSAALALVFLYLCVSSFWRARRR